MNMTNICTLLHRAGKLRLQLPIEVAELIVARLAVLDYEPRLKAQEVGNVLYGFQSMMDSLDTREIIIGLIPRIQSCNELLLGQHVGNALYGLQGFTDSPEVRQLLAVLAPKIHECREELR